MTPKSIRRPTELSERHWPWLVIGVVVALAIAGLVTLAANGLLGARAARGYTTLGLSLGLLSLAFALAAFAYSLRKRAWQETAPLTIRGTMMTWLWAHVYLGLLALVTAVLHSGVGLFTSRLSTGMILLILLALLVFSGIVWRLIYRYTPLPASAQVGNYSQVESRELARNDLIEIEKLSAGKSAEFQKLKDALLAGQPAADVSALAETERDDFDIVRAHVAGHLAALMRMRRQAAFGNFLQFWKVIHLPLVGLTLIFFIVHLAVVFDLPAQAAPAQLNGFHPASDCAQCHTAIYDQWSQSMHANALASPITIAQTNLVNATTLADAAQPDPYLLCVNCHSPVDARLTSQAALPLESPTRSADALVAEGVTCTVCHQFNGEPRSGQGGLRAFNLGLRPGRVFFGPIADPVGNSYHQSQSSRLFAQPEQLCRNCHNVTYDVNDDGLIEKGVDLILQTIFTEWERYRDSGGTQTCVSCHMPLVDAGARVAEAAEIPTEQDYASPPRLLHDHSFVGPDYRLDTVAQADPQREARAALLGKAAALALDAESVRIEEDGSLWFKVSVSNVGAGHNIPGGFSFARQMWLEVIVRDENGNALYQSGVLANNVDDLCDSGTLDDPGNPILPFVQGCAASDPQLVNFQQKLVDDVEQVLDSSGAPRLDHHGDPIVTQPKGSEETWVQSLTAGSVSRFRPSDGQELETIDPGQSREFEYQVVGMKTMPSSVTIQVRLLYRNFPPYFLRALAANQLPTDAVRLEPLIDNLQIVEMASHSLQFDLP